jgi:hypothetical protein
MRIHRPTFCSFFFPFSKTPKSVVSFASSIGEEKEKKNKNKNKNMNPCTPPSFLCFRLLFFSSVLG